MSKHVMNRQPSTSITAIGVLDEIGSHLVSLGTDHWTWVGRRSKLNLLSEDVLHELFEDPDPKCRWWKVKGESADQGLAFSSAYLEVIHDAFERIITFPIMSQLSVFLKVRDWPRTKFIKFAKWSTAAPMAKKLRNELPPCPSDVLSLIPFSGPVKRFLGTTLVSKSHRNLCFWNSVLQAVKRACIPPDDDFVAGAYEDHRQALGKKPEVCSLDLTEKTLQIMGPPPRTRTRPPVFSSSASLKTSRGDGGGMEEIVRSFNGVSFEEPLVPSLLLRMVETSPGVVKEIKGRDVPGLTELRTLVRSSKERNVVRAVGLLEPLKVRVITCGDAPMQSLMETLRKPIHDRLRSCPALALLGRPLEVRDLVELTEKANRVGLTSTRWVSGDFKAATDNLSASASEEVARALMSWLSNLEDMESLMESLFGTELVYPTPKGASSINTAAPGVPETRSFQLNGQLMGNPMSFPILSIVNLLGFWLTLEDYLGREVDLADLPVLVNGDDILFRSDDALYERWQETIRQLGLSLSVGKSYIHDKVLCLNSEMYRQTAKGLCVEDYHRVEFFNVGVLRKGFLSKTLPAPCCAVAPLLSETLKGAQNRERAKRRFLHYWKSEVEACTRSGLFNLFLPSAVGGIGADAHGLEVRTTFRQRCLAQAMWEHAQDHPHEHARICAQVTKPNVTSQCTQMLSRHQAVTWTKDRSEPKYEKRMVADLSGERRQDVLVFDPWDSWSHGRYRVPTAAFLRSHKQGVEAPEEILHTPLYFRARLPDGCSSPK